jgi:hypothetical protein
MAFVSLLPCMCLPVGLSVGLLLTIFWIWMLIDAISNEPAEGNDKLIWIIVIVLTQALGAAIYYFIRRPERIRKYGR